MKIIKFLFTIILFSAFQNLSARIHIRYGDEEKLIKKVVLPQKDIYTLDGKQHFDLGVKYTVFEIVKLPIYQTGETQIVGYVENSILKTAEPSYIELSDAELKEIALQNKLNLDEIKEIPFWDSWGGKLVFGGIVLIILFLIFMKNSNSEKKEDAPALRV